MKANPGGNLDPDSVYGRDELIEMLWDRLEVQSILLNAERRIGKTQVLRKMQAQPRKGWRPVFRDLERIHSAQEFAEFVYDEVQQFLGKGVRAKNFIQKMLEDSETDYVKLKGRTWKKLLTSAVEDLMAAKMPERLVFFWDEVPYMLGNILSSQDDGPRVAAEVLDTIRSFRVYPEGDDGDNVAILLDVLAQSADPADSKSVDQILDEAQSVGATLKNRNNLLRLLRLMDADHYLSRETDGTYRFRFPLIRRWWKLDRGL